MLSDATLDHLSSWNLVIKRNKMSGKGEEAAALTGLGKWHELCK